MARLTNKTAFVTGSGRGIGRAVALKLASEGANIVLNDLDADSAAEVAVEIEKLGAKSVSVIGSVVESGFAERFINAGIEAFGGIDIIVNNAGYTWDSFAAKMSDDQFDAMLDVHVKAPFRILREAAPHIRGFAETEAAQGREVFRKVVNISSIAGLGGNPGQANYSSAKSAIVGLTKTLSKEWGRMKVNVNCVAFGLIETRLTQATDEKKEIEVDGNRVGVGIPKKSAAAFGSMVPVGRAGTPEEAADGVYLFCSPESNENGGAILVHGSGGIVLSRAA